MFGWLKNFLPWVRENPSEPFYKPAEGDVYWNVQGDRWTYYTRSGWVKNVE